MGWLRFKEQCSSSINLRDDDAKRIIDTYRAANSAITDFWAELQSNFTKALKADISEPFIVGRLKLQHHAQEDTVRLTLPSGRDIVYRQPRIEEELFYMGVNPTTRRWDKQKLYGGKLCENICQAIARDVMRDAMHRLNRAGYQILLTVHDEILCVLPDDSGSAQEMEQLMSKAPAWAQGCPIAAEAWSGKRYRK